MKESTFSFWEDAEFGALLDQPFCYEETDWNLSQRENQAQQWFLEAQSDNGYIISVKIASKNWNKLPCQVAPMVQLVVVNPVGEVLEETQEYACSEFNKKGDQLNFQVGTNDFEQNNNLIKLQVTGQEASLKLNFTGVIDPWKPGRGKIAYADKGKKYCSWLVPIPKATVTGELELKGEKVAINGIGYYDYWDTNFPVGEILREVRKGRFYGGKGTFIFSKFKGKSLYSFKPIYAYLFAWEDQVLDSGPHFDGKFTGKQQVFLTRHLMQSELKLTITDQIFTSHWYPEANASRTMVKGDGKLTWRKTLPEYDGGVGLCERIAF